MSSKEPAWVKAEDTFQLMRFFDGIDIDENIVATYFIEVPTADPVMWAESFALEQTTGTWARSHAETKEIREVSGGKLLSLFKIPGLANAYVMQIAFPTRNIPANMGALLAAVAGNVTLFRSESQEISVKLWDLTFPKTWLKEFKGPKFGVQGIRNYLNIPERPILNNMIKPCVGHDLSVHIELFKEAAYGGMDTIKDDELLTDVPYNAFFDRLSKCMEIVDRKYQEIGEKTLYCINATDRVDKVIEKAERAVQAGANCIMLNSSLCLEVLRAVAEDPSIKVPVLYHMCFTGTITKDEKGGIYYPLYVKLARMCGADIVLVPDYRGKFTGFDRQLCLQSVSALLTPLLHIKPSLALIGGGVHPGLIPVIVESYGRDVLIGAGGAVHAHPMGSRAGARALRQAVEAVMNGTPLRIAAEKHEELRVAIQKWGVAEREDETSLISRIYDFKR
ncbi:MAG: RuBisCO large subunit C-terminal-like domain-containing protein [Nitrososphaerota archaeon]